MKGFFFKFNAEGAEIAWQSAYGKIVSNAHMNMKLGSEHLHYFFLCKNRTDFKGTEKYELIILRNIKK